VFALRSGDEELILHFSADRAFPWLLLQSDVVRARRNSADLFPGIAGRQIASVRVATGDRMIRVAFTDGSSLLFILYAGKSNALLYAADGSLEDSFKKKPSGIAALPAFDNAPDVPSLPEIEASLKNARALTAEKALRSIRPWLQGTLTREIAFRAGIELDVSVDTLDPDAVARFARTVSEALDEASRGTARIYLEDGIPARFSLVALTQLGDCPTLPDAGLLDALSTFARKRLGLANIEEVQARAVKAATREIERIERSLAKLATPEALEAQAAEHEKFGNLLMIHANDYPEQPGQMTVPDLFVDPRLVVCIPLQERLTVIENSQRYFDRARRARASVATVLSRGAYLQTRRSALTTFRSRVAATTARRALRDIFNESKDLMESLGLTSKGETNDAPFPFRRFTVFGGFEVWAGRNSANNDELTVRHAKPNDLWFHARGVGGSHVVLKCAAAAQVPKEAVREAASIAAYYSKHRNARTVPVAYTERKYVHKPKGVPSGTVYLDREKVIMAEPKLPEGEKDEA
jgi:predicted ribosome quality control (RQC) complex YloA/Tae2 family protein